mmetsp:Transcript_27741/g.60430  ORF Transcript_27741/g.60430 Transcript_27741/m.60430 type:complete len:253 (-) Transcript_27741:835-1593(-)
MGVFAFFRFSVELPCFLEFSFWSSCPTSFSGLKATKSVFSGSFPSNSLRFWRKFQHRLSESSRMLTAGMFRITMNFHNFMWDAAFASSRRAPGDLLKAISADCGSKPSLIAAWRFDLPFKHGKKAKLVLDDIMLMIFSRRVVWYFSEPQFSNQVLGSLTPFFSLVGRFLAFFGPVATICGSCGSEKITGMNCAVVAVIRRLTKFTAMAHKTKTTLVRCRVLRRSCSSCTMWDMPSSSTSAALGLFSVSVRLR